MKVIFTEDVYSRSFRSTRKLRSVIERDLRLNDEERMSVVRRVRKIVLRNESYLKESVRVTKRGSGAR
jgi:hypothetical protein